LSIENAIRCFFIFFSGHVHNKWKVFGLTHNNRWTLNNSTLAFLTRVQTSMEWYGLDWFACFQHLFYWLNSFSQQKQCTIYWLIRWTKHNTW
jgi:hypothetical protein